MEIKEGKVTDYAMRSYFRDSKLNYMFVLEIDDSVEYCKYLEQVEYNIFMRKLLGGFQVGTLSDIVDCKLKYETDESQVTKIILNNNIEL